jgi:PAS domain S-box-containing protein
MIAALHFSSFVVDILLIIYVISKDHRSRVNCLCALLIFSFAIWSFFFGLANLSNSIEEALFYFKMAGIGISAFPIAALWFYSALAHRERLLNKRAFLWISIFLMALFIYPLWTGETINSAVKTDWGWAVLWAQSTYSYCCFAYIIGCICICAVIGIRFGLSTVISHQKKQFRVTIITGGITAALGIFAGVAIQLYGYAKFPQLIDILFLIWGIGIVIAVSRYGLMSISPVVAADEILSTMNDCLLLLDVNRKIVYSNEASCTLLGVKGKQLKNTSFHSVVEDKEHAELLLQVCTNNGSGIKRELKYVTASGKTTPVLVSMSAIKEAPGKVAGFVVSAMDITEIKEAEEKIAASNVQLKKTLNDSVNTMARIVEMRDPYTSGHQQRVTILTIAIARELGMEEEQLERLKMASIIHDIGKISVPVDILCKPGKLSDLEFNILKMHSQDGYDIVKGMDFPHSVGQTVLQHHERLNGSGYPQGLKSGQIILEAKILAVADTVEAMVSDRPYRPALGIEKAMEEISQNKGNLYESDVVDICLKLFDENKFKFEL